MFELVLLYIVKVLEIIGIAVILLGVFKVLLILTRCVIKRIKVSSLMTEIRMELSNYLVLSLEIIIGRDIIETFLNPSLEDILILAVLVVLRTLLAFFLNYEMNHLPKPKLEKALDDKKQ